MAQQTDMARERFPFLDLLERNADAMWAEFQTLPSSLFIPMPSTEMYQGVWTACIVKLDQYGEEFAGLDVDANRKRCPVAAKVMDQIVGAYLALAPGASLRVHTDIRDDDVIRCHLGLRLAPHEHAYWKERTARPMDIRMPHAARNNGDLPRITFLLDVRMPFVIPTGSIPPWNPDLAPST
jgi:hypothetical protein